jgi:hypothetical protein
MLATRGFAKQLILQLIRAWFCEATVNCNFGWEARRYPRCFSLFSPSKPSPFFIHYSRQPWSSVMSALFAYLHVCIFFAVQHAVKLKIRRQADFTGLRHDPRSIVWIAMMPFSTEKTSTKSCRLIEKALWGTPEQVGRDTRTLLGFAWAWLRH